MAGLLRRILSKVAPARLLEVGTPAPDFEVEAHDSSAVRLSDLRGRTVLLWFYPKADTPGCTVEGKGLCSSYADFESRGVTILGVSFDDREANAAFAARFGFPFLLLCDTDRRIGLAYGACDHAEAGHARRISYVIDEQGIVRHVLPKVDPATHTADILALLG